MYSYLTIIDGRESFTIESRCILSSLETTIDQNEGYTPTECLIAA